MIEIQNNPFLLEHINISMSAEGLKTEVSTDILLVENPELKSTGVLFVVSKLS
jgi:protocatechuate 3,4-dioxygenase beta subunit